MCLPIAATPQLWSWKVVVVGCDSGNASLVKGYSERGQWKSGLLSMAASLPILTFHALDDRSSAISFAPHVFQRGMARLHEGGYRALSLLEAGDGLRHGKPFPDRAFVLTFDDGYQSVYTEAFPVLQHYGWSATVFLTVGQNRKVSVESRLPAMEDRPMLAWREIQEMHRWGLDFGAHTLTHPDLTRLPVDHLQAEVCDSQTIIAEALGTAVASFAYPYGRHDQRSRELVQQHFACAVSDTLGLTTARSDLYALERVDAYYLRTDLLFALMLTPWLPWYIWARSVPRKIRRAGQINRG
jgi:peptidoglycan/xylan/chitin deacetylase (PgdA/CDA1 family)